jgi:integrase
MASIFKRRKGKNVPYTIQYVDHLGKRRTKIGFTDKGLSEQLAGKLESDARLRRTGLIDPVLEKAQELKLSAIEDHLLAFEASISDNTPKYVSMVMTRVRRVIRLGKVTCLGDISNETILGALQSMQSEPNFGHRTYNHYLQAFAAFCNWCVQCDRLPRKPIAMLEPLNAEVDVRRKRRALNADEFAKLILSARESGILVQRFDGETRARIYTISYLTGLRKNEIASLTPRSFDLTSEPRTLTIEAASSKHRKQDVLPLHPDLVACLSEWLFGLEPSEKLFPNLARKELGFLTKRRRGLPTFTLQVATRTSLS